MAANANVGEHHMMFEPVHGSAPRHSGMNKVNPIAMIASVQLMLAELGARHEDRASRVCAELLDASIAEVIGEGSTLSYDLGGAASTTDVGIAIGRRPRSPSDVHVLRVAMIEIEDHEPGIRVVRFSGEVASQAFTVESLDRIVEVVSSALREEAVRGLVLIGTGRFFLAGADVRAFQDGLEQGTVVSMIHELTGRLHPLELEMRRSSTVCIAAINGAAAGEGSASPWHATGGWLHRVPAWRHPMLGSVSPLMAARPGSFRGWSVSRSHGASSSRMRSGMRSRPSIWGRSTTLSQRRTSSMRPSRWPDGGAVGVHISVRRRSTSSTSNPLRISNSSWTMSAC